MLLRCMGNINISEFFINLSVLHCELSVVVFRDHLENRDQQDQPVRKDLQDQLVFLVLTDLVVTLVLM